jgi:hypothetical protein
MKDFCRRAAVGVLVAMLLAPLWGCFIISDLFNNNVAASLGLTVGGSQGVVIVAFENSTTLPAEFRAYVSRDPIDLTRDSRNFSNDVAAGEVTNEVLECPVGLVAPGTLGETFAADTVAAVVTTDAGETPVNYTGPPLVSPDLTCGDLVVIRLVETGAGGTDEAAFAIVFTVVPG